MNTIIHKIEDTKDDMKIREAATCIKNGGIIAYPTETLYGLGVDALNSEAVKKIYDTKGRVHSKALTIITASKHIEEYVESVSESAKRLIEEFWPGPLTIIFKKKDIIPDITSGNLKTIGIRMTSNEVALKLIEYSETVITATSANISGKPSHAFMEECIEELSGKVDYIIGEDKRNIGIESTIIDCTVDPPVVLRKGAITLEMLKEVDSNIE